MDKGDPWIRNKEDKEVEEYVIFNREKEIYNSDKNMEIPPKKEGKIVYSYSTEDEAPFKVLCKNKNSARVDESYISFLLNKHNHEPASFGKPANKAIDAFFDSYEEANAAASDVELNKIIDCFIPKHYIFIEGIIKGVDAAHEMKDICDYFRLNNKKVKGAKRLLNKDGSRSNKIGVTFRLHKLPKEVYLYGCPKTVKAYNQVVRCCMKCGRFGHLEEKCESKETLCNTCFNKHNGECRLIGCKNCGNKNHVWTDSCCENYKNEEKLVELMFSENISRAKARDILYKKNKDKNREVNFNIPSSNFPPLRENTVERPKSQTSRLNQKVTIPKQKSYAETAAANFEDMYKPSTSKAAIEKQRNIEKMNKFLGEFTDEIINELNVKLIDGFNSIVVNKEMPKDWQRELAEQLTESNELTMKKYFDDKIQSLGLMEKEKKFSAQKRIAEIREEKISDEATTRKIPRLNLMRKVDESYEEFNYLKQFDEKDANKIVNEIETLKLNMNMKIAQRDLKGGKNEKTYNFSPDTAPINIKATKTRDGKFKFSAATEKDNNVKSKVVVIDDFNVKIVDEEEKENINSNKSQTNSQENPIIVTESISMETDELEGGSPSTLNNLKTQPNNG